MVPQSRFDDVLENHIIAEITSESSFRYGSSGGWVIFSHKGLIFGWSGQNLRENDRIRTIGLKDRVVVGRQYLIHTASGRIIA